MMETATTTAVIERVERVEQAGVGNPPTMTDLLETYNRAGVYDVEALQADAETYLESTVNVREVDLDRLAGIFAMIHENYEREEWRYYTREEWAELEHAWVEKSEFTEPDLRDDLFCRQEHGNLTATEAHGEYEKHRECKYLFCLYVFKPKRKDQRFCGRNCKERQKEAVKRFERTGTYLPEHAYRDNRDETDERNYKGKETAYETESITDLIEPFERQRKYGRKRDRQREEAIGFTPKRVDTKGESSPVISRGADIQADYFSTEK